MRFVFLQSELRSKTNSHFYQYLQAIEDALISKGHTCLTIANEVFDIENSDKKGTIAFKNHISRYSNPLAVLWRILSRNVSGYFEFARIMNLITKQDSQTVFFVDTIQNERVIALAWAFKKLARKNASIRMAVVFRFTYQSNSAILTWLQKKLHLLFCSILHDLIGAKKCILFTDSKALQEAYRHNISAPVSVMPIPLRSHLYEQMQNANQHRISIKTIGFIGGKVGYKGLDKFLIQFILLVRYDIRFLIHGIRDSEDLLSFAQLVLSNEAFCVVKQNIDKIETCYHLDEKEYMNLFNRMDVILIPYTSLQFAEGTSNIFAESVSAGVIPVVPSTTWMGDELMSGGFQELVVNFSDDQSTHRSITGILENSIALKQKMNAFSSSWRAYHSSDNFANRFIQALQN